MSVDILMPALSPTMEEGTLVAWTREFDQADAPGALNADERAELFPMRQTDVDASPLELSDADHVMVADAERIGFLIRPDCSYVAAKFAENPDWASLKA